MIKVWWAEARRNDVLPLDNRVLEIMAHGRPPRVEQRRYRYFQNGAPVPEFVSVDVRNRSHEIAVSIEVAEGTTPTGVLLALGCVLGGWSLHFVDSRLRYVHNLHGKKVQQVTADTLLGPGRHEIGFRFDKDEGLGGRAELRIDGKLAGEGLVDRFTPVAFNEVGIGVTCGYEWGPAVGSGYAAPFPFNGKILRAEVTTTGPDVRDPVSEVAAILASQ